MVLGHRWSDIRSCGGVEAPKSELLRSVWKIRVWYGKFEFGTENQEFGTENREFGTENLIIFYRCRARPRPPDGRIVGGRYLWTPQTRLACPVALAGALLGHKQTSAT